VAGAGWHPDRLSDQPELASLYRDTAEKERRLGAAGDARLMAGFAGLAPPVAVACSGGPDSLALLALAMEAGLEPVAVHVDHGARATSAAEADVVAGFAERLGSGFASERVAVPPGPNFEARAREARYEALERARERLGATAVLVGHSRDDQAETVLLNVLRGAGVTGLAGMPARRGTIARPLLGVPRADLAAVCARLGLSPIVDPMNADTAHRRVWLRREVIPALEAGAARDLRAVLARQAAIARTDSDYLDALAEDLLAKAGSGLSSGLDIAVLAAGPEALVRRAVRMWLGAPPPPAGHIEDVLAVIRGERRAADLPGGVEVGRAGGRLNARHLQAAESPPDVASLEVALPGAASGFGLELTSWVERAAPVRWPDGRWTAVLDADLAGDRAVLRQAAPGERFVPLGLVGHKTVTDALAEAGVPVQARATHPILARPGANGAAEDPDGSALWVLGYRIDDRVRVSPGTRRFLWLTVEAGGPQG
jgi:tRNA(Ile)-lysidine synthase